MVIPAFARAQAVAAVSQTFKARVVQVVDEKTVIVDDETVIQHNLKLIGLTGNLKNKEFFVDEIGQPATGGRNVYKTGNEVIVQQAFDENGTAVYEITDYVRTAKVLWLVAAFVISLLIVGRWKGLRSILSLVLTFLVLIKYVVPQILDGADPIIVTVIGSFVVLLIIIYLTEGFNATAHASVVSIFISLVLTVFLSWLFVGLTNLSGLASEEASFIVGLGVGSLNLRGILLAGIIIGALGVLDDVAISQVAAVSAIYGANQSQTKKEIWRKAMKVGVSHISSMSNTLFLAYAGASLPLLILFVSGQSAFTSWDIAINNEMLATEIVRTLAGSIGLIFTVPIATLMAIAMLTNKKS